uniref:Uncharacterized protein n=1 Tax=Arundo donax TaxID=35708 RepID=A0A0A8XTN3_ARUDO
MTMLAVARLCITWFSRVIKLTTLGHPNCGNGLKVGAFGNYRD